MNEKGRKKKKKRRHEGLLIWYWNLAVSLFAEVCPDSALFAVGRPGDTSIYLFSWRRVNWIYFVTPVYFCPIGTPVGPRRLHLRHISYAKIAPFG